MQHNRDKLRLDYIYKTLIIIAGKDSQSMNLPIPSL